MAVRYEDDFCRLSDYTLTVKNFHMPCKGEKIEDIRVVYFEEQKCCKFTVTRVWGRAVAPIQWALDLKRCLPTSHRWNVVVDVGAESNVRTGFSVQDVEAFLDALKGLVEYHVIIMNKINL